MFTLGLKYKAIEDVDVLTGRDPMMTHYEVEFTVNSRPRSIEDTVSLLNSRLASRSVLSGDGKIPGEKDIGVFAAIYSYVVSLEDSVKDSLPHLMKWFACIESSDEYLQQMVEGQPLSASKPAEKGEVGSAAEKTAKDAETAKKVNAPKSEMSRKVKKKLPEKVVKEKDKDVSVSLLNVLAEKYPYSLLGKETDTSDASPEELIDRLMVLNTNVKLGKLRYVMSERLGLCASSKYHTVVEPLIASEGAKIGEIIAFSGHDGKPEAVLNKKEIQLDAASFHRRQGRHHIQEICWALGTSIPKASIK